MDSDDALIGRLLTRREVLTLLGAAGAAVLVGCGGSSDKPAATSTSAAAEAPQSAVSALGSGVSDATGAAASTAGVSTSLPACVVLPALTEGPYFVDGSSIARMCVRTRQPAL
jgi:drug/metabolite transporter (DMT)-like permease